MNKNGKLAKNLTNPKDKIENPISLKNQLDILYDKSKRNDNTLYLPKGFSLRTRIFKDEIEY